MTTAEMELHLQTKDKEIQEMQERLNNVNLELDGGRHIKM